MKSKKDSFRERLGQKYADSGLNLDDEETMYGRINDDYDDYERRLAENDERIKGYEENESKIGNMIANDPRSAAFFSAWSNGGHPIVEMIRRYGIEILDAASDPEILKEIEEASMEYNKMVSEGQEMARQYDDNFAECVEEWKKYSKKNGLDEGASIDALQSFAQAMADFDQGKFTPEDVMRFHKGGAYDNDVASARHEGEIDGKNAKIEETMKKSAKKKSGPTNLGGGGSARQEQGSRRLPGAFGNIASRKSIWDTGK